MNKQLSYLRISLGIILTILILFGPYNDFFTNEALLLASPIKLAPWCFWLLKYTVLFLSILLFINNRILTFLLCILFGFFNYYISSFSMLWNYNTHLNFFLVLLTLATKNNVSFIISSMQFIVGLLYFQSGLSKLLYGGIEWMEQGQTLLTYTHILGTPFGKSLTTHPNIFIYFSFATVLFEMSFLPLLLIKKARPILGLSAIFFHLCITSILNISFWHLWLLYPALFMFEQKS